jgi:hypothetical protein
VAVFPGDFILDVDDGGVRLTPTSEVQS